MESTGESWVKKTNDRWFREKGRGRGRDAVVARRIFAERKKKAMAGKQPGARGRPGPGCPRRGGHRRIWMVGC